MYELLRPSSDIEIDIDTIRILRDHGEHCITTIRYKYSA